MKSTLIGMLVAAAFVLPPAGYAAEGATRTFVKDSMITTKVKAKLAKQKPSTLAKVSVDTDKSGVVVLSGSAKTQADKDRAETVARGIKGVATVENNIEIKP
jgi:hyperosmotically inducible protein